MLNAVRSTIYHVLNLAGKAVRPTVAIEAFNELQLRDIGLTRDEERIRVRVADVGDPRRGPVAGPSGPSPSPEPERPEPRRCITVSPRAQVGENKDISISLCD